MSVQIIATTTLHHGWTKLLRLRLRLGNGEEVVREVEDHGRAVAILPYDPVRRTAMLVRLLRAPVLFAAGIDEVLEAPAGLVEEADPAETARRELHEETGLRVHEVEHVGSVWTSPGISTERMELYLGRYSAGDRVGPGGGVEGENENITVVEMPLDELRALAQGKDIIDMKTLTLILMLQARHPQLFERSSSGASATRS